MNYFISKKPITKTCDHILLGKLQPNKDLLLSVTNNTTHLYSFNIDYTLFLLKEDTFYEKILQIEKYACFYCTTHTVSDTGDSKIDSVSGGDDNGSDCRISDNKTTHNYAPINNCISNVSHHNIIILFKNAKLSTLSYNHLSNCYITTSLRYFEKEEYDINAQHPSFFRLSKDIGVLHISPTHFSLFPLNKQEGYHNPNTCGNNTSNAYTCISNNTPFTELHSSVTFKYLQISPTLYNITDITFLSYSLHPTLAFLYNNKILITSYNYNTFIILSTHTLPLYTFKLLYSNEVLSCLGNNSVVFICKGGVRTVSINHCSKGHGIGGDSDESEELDSNRDKVLDNGNDNNNPYDNSTISNTLLDNGNDNNTHYYNSPNNNTLYTTDTDNNTLYNTDTLIYNSVSTFINNTLLIFIPGVTLLFTINKEYNTIKDITTSKIKGCYFPSSISNNDDYIIIGSNRSNMYLYGIIRRRGVSIDNISDVLRYYDNKGGESKSENDLCDSVCNDSVYDKSVSNDNDTNNTNDNPNPNYTNNDNNDNSISTYNNADPNPTLTLDKCINNITTTTIPLDSNVRISLSLIKVYETFGCITSTVMTGGTLNMEMIFSSENKKVIKVFNRLEFVVKRSIKVKGFNKVFVCERNSKLEDVNNSTDEQRGVNNSLNDQQGVNNSTNEQQGINNSTDEQQGVNNLSSDNIRYYYLLSNERESVLVEWNNTLLEVESEIRGEEETLLFTREGCYYIQISVEGVCVINKDMKRVGEIRIKVKEGRICKGVIYILSNRVLYLLIINGVNDNGIELEGLNEDVNKGNIDNSNNTLNSMDSYEGVNRGNLDRSNNTLCIINTYEGVDCFTTCDNLLVTIKGCYLQIYYLKKYLLLYQGNISDVSTVIYNTVKGVNDSGSNLEGVSNTTNEQQGVSPITDNNTPLSVIEISTITNKLRTVILLRHENGLLSTYEYRNRTLLKLYSFMLFNKTFTNTVFLVCRDIVFIKGIECLMVKVDNMGVFIHKSIHLDCITCISDTELEEGGVDYKDIREQGVNNSTHKQQGVNYKGVSDKDIKEVGVNNSTHKQQGVNVISDKQQGVNYNTDTPISINTPFNLNGTLSKLTYFYISKGVLLESHINYFIGDNLYEEFTVKRKGMGVAYCEREECIVVVGVEECLFKLENNNGNNDNKINDGGNTSDPNPTLTLNKCINNNPNLPTHNPSQILDTNTPDTNNSNTNPLTYQYYLDLYRSNTLIDSYKLQPNEYICMMKYMLLNDTQEILPFIVCCTAYIKGEDNICRGRLLIFQLKSVVPHPNKPLTTLRLGVIAIENTKGPVVCCDVLRHKICVGIGTKIFVYEVSPSEGLNAIAFHDMHVMCCSITCFKNYIVVGDICRGVSMFYFQSRPVKVYLLGVSEAVSVLGVIYVMKVYMGGVSNIVHEYKGVSYEGSRLKGVSNCNDKQHPFNNSTNNQHPVNDNLNNQDPSYVKDMRYKGTLYGDVLKKYENEVGMVCFDESTLYCYTYSPYNLLSKNGSFLIKRSEIMINEELRVGGSGNIGVLFSRDSFIKITVLNEKSYNILIGLCNNIKGGVNYRNMGIGKNVLKGMCVKASCFYQGVLEFLRYGFARQNEISKEIGVEWEEVMSIIEEARVYY